MERYNESNTHVHLKHDRVVIGAKASRLALPVWA